MAPPRYRGAISNGFPFSLNMGALSSNLINYGTVKLGNDLGWRISLSMASIPASVLSLGAIFLPETPNSLIQRTQNHHKAKSTLQRIRGTDDVHAELTDLVKASDVAETNLHPFRKIAERKYRPQLVMAIAIPFFQQATGINAIAFYAPKLFRTAGLGKSASILSVLVIRIASASSTFISMLVVDKLGRRVLFSVGVQMLASQVTVGCIMKNQLGDYEGKQGIRSAGQSINVAVSFLFTIIMAQTYLLMLCHFKAGIFFFFGWWVAVMTGFVYLFLPETKNVPIEQVDRVWKEHWFWKRIVGDV
ncbi:hypothetical protein RHMOL_Rhmol09G0248700 [Rhododendron molle]|uniref:Uncharacterized protein n=1 Tax=Rhododendron molle TaxID=49168 RepID=A0ACC0MHB5_RHOML|nr:hypothetical protein RHMOL_Rhmol09G0248700 [Rhododendron molle]